jgi:Rho termination factor-like protein
MEVEANMVQKKAGTGVKNKAGTGVKNKALYKRLRNLGVSVKESTRVANSSAKASGKRASQPSGAASSFANLKVPELRRRAKQAGVKGRSTMNKKQLIKALRGA